MVFRLELTHLGSFVGWRFHELPYNEQCCLLAELLTQAEKVKDLTPGETPSQTLERLQGLEYTKSQFAKKLEADGLDPATIASVLADWR